MNNDQSYVIQHDNPIVGKCLIAARDLEAGEKILEEKPLGEQGIFAPGLPHFFE